jgi:hypothetical protein
VKYVLCQVELEKSLDKGILLGPGFFHKSPQGDMLVLSV